MKVTIIPIVIYALGTVTKGLVQGLEDLEITGRVEAVQTTVFFLDRLEYWEESWRLEESFFFTQTPVRNHQLTLVW